MKNEKAIKLISKIDDKYIDEALSYGQDGNNEPEIEKKSGHRRMMNFRWVAAAAAVILIVVTGFTIHNISAEAKEYAAAVEYFKTNGMSTEGLSRTEIKETYRRIITTKAVIENGEIAKQGDKEPEKTEVTTAPGLEIKPEDTPAEVKRKIVEQEKWTEEVAGYYYHNEVVDFFEANEETMWNWVSQESTVSCSYGGKQLWTVKLPCDIYNFIHLQGKSILWGYMGEMPNELYVTAISDDGELLWTNIMDHEFKLENVYTALDNGDGFVEIVSRGALHGVAITLIDPNGNEVTRTVTDLGVSCKQVKAARFGDGHLVSVSDENRSSLFALDREGRITGKISFGEEGYKYWIRDIIEYQGHVILSAYSVPKTDKAVIGMASLYRIPKVRDFIINNYPLSYFEEKGDKITDGTEEGLTQVVRDTFTAILLVCDPENVTPKAFCSVEGAVGCGLSFDGSGHLVWEIQNIETTNVVGYENYTAYCKVLRYVFDSDFTLTEQVDTGEIVRFNTMPEDLFDTHQTKEDSYYIDE